MYLKLVRSFYIMNKQKSLWCPLAFNGIMCKTNGAFKTCCAGSKTALDFNNNEINRSNYTLEQAFNTEFFKKIRNNLKNGVKDSNCQRCWEEENIGIESYRQKQIKKFGTQSFDKNIKYIDLALGNQCNLKCRICRLDDSTSWIKETWDTQDRTSPSLKNFIAENTTNSPQHFLDNIKNELIDNATFLSFFGGEPFLMKSTWEILNYAVKKGIAGNIDLMFNTNGTIWNQNKENILSKFKSVELHLSIDGTDKKFNYTRHPANWHRFVDNLKKMMSWMNNADLPVNIVLDYSVSNYNVYDIPEFISFCNKMNLEYYINIVIDPDYLCIANLPQRIKQSIAVHYKNSLDTKQLKNVELQKILGYLEQYAYNEIKWREFLIEVEKRDQYRKESFKNCFSEYYKIIENKGFTI